MRLAQVQCDGDEKTFEAYTDGSLWNGWLNIWFTREQLSAWLNESPYDYRFCEPKSPLNSRDRSICIMYFEDQDIIDSSFIFTDDGKPLEVYSMNGFCFYEMENE